MALNHPAVSTTDFYSLVKQQLPLDISIDSMRNEETLDIKVLNILRAL